MKKSLFSTKAIVATAIGAALFFVLGRFAAVPTGIPNTNFALQYSVLSFFAAVFGPICGGLVGLIGHALIDLSYGGGIWWSWVIASAAAGIVVGLCFNMLNIGEGKFGAKQIVIFVLFNVLAYAISFALLAPAGDIVIYHDVPSKVFVQGLWAFGSDTVFGAVIGGLLCFAYTKTIAKPGSLDKE